MRREYSIERSENLYQRARKTLPFGTTTDAKKPIELFKGYMPLFIERGQGCRVVDVDGNIFIDYRCALGKIILGYGHPVVNLAVSEQLERGVIFSMANSLEVKLAERLIDFIPCAEMVQFGKTNADMFQAAIRLARYYTKKEKVISCGLNSWHDWCVAKDKSHREKGIPDKFSSLVYDLKYNDIKTLRKIIKKDARHIAALVTVPYDWGENTRQDFMQELRWLTSRNKIILIFDETLTGFRLSMGGGQTYFKITPDFSIFSNAIANGHTLSVLVGREKFMKKINDLYIGNTSGGETLALMASLVTIEEMNKHNVIKHIWGMGERLMTGFDHIAQEVGVKARAIGLPPACTFLFEEKDPKLNKSFYRVFCCEMFRNGIFVNDNMYITYAHKDKEIDETLAAIKESMQTAKRRIMKM
jgi:glutamate-1-semialdehyde 2,1-aminomutase